MCTRRLQARRGPEGKLYFGRGGWTDQDPYFMVEVPCGKCIECKLRKKRDWAIRAVHEASTHERNCFVTLTYNDEHLPADRSVRKSVLQKFLKRLRKNQPELRYLGCGEYGAPENGSRPHYHLCIFGEDFSDDRTPWQPSPKGYPQWRSARLEKAWRFGYSTIGTLTADSASYTAAYTVKKMTGPKADKAYVRYTENGSMWYVEPEFALMSRNGERKGLGTEWIKRYASDVYGSPENPRSSCLLKNKEVPPPLFYDKYMSANHPEWWAAVQDQRKLLFKDVESTRQEEKAREVYAEKRLSLGGGNIFAL